MNSYNSTSRWLSLASLGITPDVALEQRPRLWVSITGYGRSEPGGSLVAFGDDAAAAGGAVLHDDHGPLFCADALGLVERFGTAAFDYAHAGMFLHHLGDVQVLTALRIMDRLTTRGLIWNDLVRGGVEAIGVRLLALGGPAMVRHDAIASVAAAFTRREALDLARRVGLSNVRYRRHLFGRFTLVSSKTR